MKTDIFKDIRDIHAWALDNEKKLVSHFNIQEKFDDIHIRYHHALSKLFGISSDLTKKGKLKSNFNFESRDFILLSFKSYKGQIPSSPEVASVVNNKINRRRYNLFRKGKIWSDKDYKYGRNFYYFLDKINEAFHETPINFVSYCVHEYLKNPSPYHLTITQNYKKAKDEGLLFFPSAQTLRKLNNDNINKILDIFSIYLKDDYLKNLAPLDEVKAHQNELAGLKHQLTDLAENDLFKNITDIFCAYFNISKSLLNDKIGNFNQTIQEKIILCAISYSYNHLPYDLHLFYSATKKLEFDNLFTIMVAINPGTVFENKDVELFKEVVGSSPNIPDYEFKLNENAKNNTESLIRWKYIYEQNLDKYSTFISAVENVCKSLCKRYGIKETTSSRLKTFESFYNKIIDRANKKEKLSNGFTYLDAINKPDEFKDSVFQDIRDIAGVRIICVYDDDVWSLGDKFKKEVEMNDLECSDFKKYKQNRVDASNPSYKNYGYNYRGFHLTVQPGEERKKLIEYENIDFVQCEIQIRTNFAHGWSDVEHPMIYKDKLHLEIIDEKFHADLEKKLESISESLKNHDEEIAELKKKRERYKFPITE